MSHSLHSLWNAFKCYSFESIKNSLDTALNVLIMDFQGISHFTKSNWRIHTKQAVILNNRILDSHHKSNDFIIVNIKNLSFVFQKCFVPSVSSKTYRENESDVYVDSNETSGRRNTYRFQKKKKKKKKIDTMNHESISTIYNSEHIRFCASLSEKFVVWNVRTHSRENNNSLEAEKRVSLCKFTRVRLNGIFHIENSLGIHGNTKSNATQ